MYLKLKDKFDLREIYDELVHLINEFPKTKCYIELEDFSIISLHLFGQKQEETVFGKIDIPITHKELNYINNNEIGYIVVEIKGEWDFNRENEKLELYISSPYFSIRDKKYGKEIDYLSFIEFMEEKININEKEKIKIYDIVDNCLSKIEEHIFEKLYYWETHR